MVVAEVLVSAPAASGLAAPITWTLALEELRPEVGAAAEVEEVAGPAMEEAVVGAEAAVEEAVGGAGVAAEETAGAAFASQDSRLYVVLLCQVNKLVD
ncbi:hypothetical protein CDL15_Pgr003865 [Punica granatum]|uniref:Uncharacterized protein n=1 Tax=Punica granatum TaxID=22663 RepID=A0A218XU38_PUNGR|nr:hypothetical protein CDL15_Pgr003865 [Punica granatum]